MRQILKKKPRDDGPTQATKISVRDDARHRQTRRDLLPFYQNQELMNTTKAILAMVASAAAGAALGILFAPDKGRETRKKMMQKGEDIGDAIDRRIEQKYEEMETKLDSLLKGMGATGMKYKNDKPIPKAEAMN
jgi:hypothetical protein